MNKLYFRVYVHFVAIIVVFGVVVAVGWMVRDRDDDHRHRLDAVADLVAQALPGDEAALTTTLARLADDFRVRLALYRADRTLLASAGTPVPPPPKPGRTSSGWQRGNGDPALSRHSQRSDLPYPQRWRRGDGGPVFLLRLPDERWLSVRPHRRSHGHWLGLLAVLAIVIAVGAYPIARRITRRLERLQTQVDALGAGDLGARVDVEGSDEIAELARSFNRAAERIESLVAVQRTMLASASHELRTPLARMRMAIELFVTAPRPELRERIERDVVELDNLIDELLLASRLETVHDLEAAERVDLLALTAEEGARVGAAVIGDSAGIDGDRRLLRHLVRNLFENARRHGAGAEISASVTGDENGVLLRICDRGPGVPEGERERIFAPFYRPAAMREEGAGVGLGLHLVKVIAERHGGSAGYRPNEPAGSCFVVRFPSAAEPHEPPLPPP